MKKKLRSGSGELLGFTMSALALLSITTLIIGCCLLHSALNYMDEVGRVIGRDVVVCESKSEAEKLAQKEAERALSNVKYLSNISTSVEYAPGSENKWKKGNLVYITVSATVHSTTPLTSGPHVVYTLMMIERGKSD